MDYSVPSVEQILEEGANYIDGRYHVALATEKMWERWEVLDRRAVAELDAAIQHLSELKYAVEKVLDEQGSYNWSDHR